YRGCDGDYPPCASVVVNVVSSATVIVTPWSDTLMARDVVGWVSMSVTGWTIPVVGSWILAVLCGWILVAVVGWILAIVVDLALAITVTVVCAAESASPGRRPFITPSVVPTTMLASNTMDMTTYTQ
ncbi:hypothetical protein BD779DRAFT_1559768, partial [Infundibulicybe gibba]